MTRSQPRVGYLLNLFPKRSETFVPNEVGNLQHAGLDILPISLERSSRLGRERHRVLHDPELRAQLAQEGRRVAQRVFDVRDATRSLVDLSRSKAIPRS
jgi:hypothetical protein